MAKRKAVEVEEDAPSVAKRRSSRHKPPSQPDLQMSTTTSDSDETNAENKPPVQIKRAEPKTHVKKSIFIFEDKLPIVASDFYPDLTTQSQKNSISKPQIITTVSTTPAVRQYWLMKAEPESRFEKGKDVKFSIDDLAARTKPEPWDGIRAYPARNNLRAMKKEDLAFFYHSNCKVPAIVGIMEIVNEHSPDLTAQDPKEPYYDPKDTDPVNPKWSVVHVEFRKRFKSPITLKELRGFQTSSKELVNMQMLKQSRLSVSKVTKEEWDFLMDKVNKNEAEED